MGNGTDKKKRKIDDDVKDGCFEGCSQYGCMTIVMLFVIVAAVTKL